MAAIWLEGFETHLNNAQFARKYATQSGGFATAMGRIHGNAGGLNSAILVTPSKGLQDTMGVSFALRINAQTSGLNSGAQGLYFERGLAEQVHLEFVNNVGSFEVKLVRGDPMSGGAVLATTSATYTYGIWHHFELKVTCHPSTGAYELRHDEVTAFSGSGVNTANSGSAQADIFAFRFTTAATSNVLFDDVLVWNNAGAKNNDFVGDVVIEGLLPNAIGNSTQWTNDAGAGNNWENVDDAATANPDETGVGGTNSSDTNGQKDLYGYQDLSVITGNILAVQVGTQLAMAAAGSRQVKLRYRDDGGTEADGSTYDVNSTTFDEFVDVFDDNPQSATTWNVNDIDGGQFGVEVVS